MRHDDPLLAPLSQRASQIQNAIALATTVKGLERFLVTALGDRYRVRVAETADGVTVGLWKLPCAFR